MKINEGTVDRVMRGIAGAVLLATGLVLVKGTIGVGLDVLGAILLVTGVVGFCPLYTLFGLKTSKKA